MITDSDAFHRPYHQREQEHLVAFCLLNRLLGCNALIAFHV